MHSLNGLIFRLIKSKRKPEILSDFNMYDNLITLHIFTKKTKTFSIKTLGPDLAVDYFYPFKSIYIIFFYLWFKSISIISCNQMHDYQ
jgi:hypothetical protein